MLRAAHFSEEQLHHARLDADFRFSFFGQLPDKQPDPSFDFIPFFKPQRPDYLFFKSERIV